MDQMSGGFNFRNAGLMSADISNVKNFYSNDCFTGCNHLSEISLPSSLIAMATFNKSMLGMSNAPLTGVTVNSLLFLEPTSFNGINSGWISLPWAEGELSGEPWGAGPNVDIIYRNEIHYISDDAVEPSGELAFYLPLHENTDEVVSGKTFTYTAGNASKITYQELSGHQCAYFGVVGLQFKDVSGINLKGDITLSVWFKATTQSNNWETYIRFGKKTTNQALNLAGIYQGHIYGGNDGKDIGYAFGDTSPIPNLFDTWFHHVVTYDSTSKEVYVYLNGKLIGGEAVNLSLQMGSDYLRLGNTNRQCNPRYIHDFRIYNAYLTQNEVLWLYENQC